MVRLLVTYMEQLAPPQGGALSSPLAAAGIAEERPDADDYLSLYQSIGVPLQWDERLRMTREGLLAFLRSRSTALYILRHDGQSVGLCEFVGVGERDVELKHFG
ncbi:MAG: GNAT family N-acetyltransferase, partial [Rhizobium sp.]